MGVRGVTVWLMLDYTCPSVGRLQDRVEVGASVILTPACMSTLWAFSVGQGVPAYGDFKDTAVEASQAAALLRLSVHPESSGRRWTAANL